MTDPREPDDHAQWSRPTPPSTGGQGDADPPPTPPDQSWQQAPQQPPQQPWTGGQPGHGAPWPGQQQWPQQPGPQQHWQPGQYADQPYPQQWPQQPYGTAQPYGTQPYGQAQPYGYGEVPPTPADGGKRSRTPLFIVLAVLIVVGVGVGAIYYFAASSTLDRQAAEAGVTQVLTESYGLQNVADASCPAGQKVKKDDTFSCTVTIDGESRSVTVTFVDDDGTYEVGRPS
ncbi:DUF4333 domain-containing protein [Aldersonia sp. NBC_00410]|uniref:DUF4333 domain-containing protein n=1 Tax=Aldersonia sp. NBC_00410 TaxID=2975954 RepID=UPI00224CE4D5|nr:DUF4333 domain-containing protein [Aldersonia sp. NBC_00410]MCX5045823.1 DUF4333 domain-containing protein [Aldersonia sp. NBC_00410]